MIGYEKGYFLVDFWYGLLTGCSPRNYFLVNSDLVARYNRTTGNWEVIWNTSLKHRGMAPDSIPIIVSRDSVRP